MREDIDFSAVFDPPPASEPFLEPEVLSSETLPAITDLDTQPVALALIAYDRQVDLMVQRAKDVVVIDQATQVVAVGCATQAKKLNAVIERVRKHYVEAPNRYVKDVNNLAKRYQDKLAQIETGLKRKISDFQFQLEMDRRKAEAAAREESRKLQEKLNEEAKAASEATGEVVEAPQVVVPIAPAKPAVVRTADGSASQRAHWTFEVTDSAKVPRGYLVIDHNAIRQAIKGGVREIPGVRVYEEFTTVIR